MITQIIVGFGVLGENAQRFVVLLNRLVKSAETRQRQARIIMDALIIRCEPQDVSQDLHGFFGFSLDQQFAGAVDLSHKALGPSATAGGGLHISRLYRRKPSKPTDALPTQRSRFCWALVIRRRSASSVLQRPPNRNGPFLA